MSNAYRSSMGASAVLPTGDAVEANVLAGKTFSNAQGTGKTGTMVNRGAVSQTIQPGGSYTIPEGYHNGSGTVTASPKTTYKSIYFNPSATSVNFKCGFEFTPEDLEGFTTITLTSNIQGFDLQYIVDDNSYASLATGNNPLTIPSFTTKLIVVANGSVVTHGLVEVTAALS